MVWETKSFVVASACFIFNKLYEGKRVGAAEKLQRCFFSSEKQKSFRGFQMFFLFTNGTSEEPKICQWRLNLTTISARALCCIQRFICIKELTKLSCCALCTVPYYYYYYYCFKFKWNVFDGPPAETPAAWRNEQEKYTKPSQTNTEQTGNKVKQNGSPTETTTTAKYQRKTQTNQLWAAVTGAPCNLKCN